MVGRVGCRVGVRGSDVAQGRGKGNACDIVSVWGEVAISSQAVIKGWRREGEQRSIWGVKVVGNVG